MLDQDKALFGRSLWESIKRGLLEKNPNNPSLSSWLNPISVENFVDKEQGACLILSVPSEFHRYHIIENLMDNFFIEAQGLFPNLTIDLIVKPPSVDQNRETKNFLKESESTEQAFWPTQQIRKVEFLDPNFTFSTFVVGKNSEFAHAACYNAALNPGEVDYNPLLICGPVGMGKTHLLHAVGHEIVKRNPSARIAYLQAERFLNEFIAALRAKKQDELRAKYRDHIDVLLFDDIQFIGKGESTQEEFFHIFNSLIEKKKQIVLASDRRPKDIIKLHDRNRSRLEWGLTVDITMPDFETRLAILRFKAELLNLKLSDEVMAYIAKVAKRSIREMEGALKTLKMFSELQGVPIDMSLTKKILSSQESSGTLTGDDIIRLTCDHFNLSINDIKSSSRAKPIVVPRQIAMFLMKKHLGKSYVEIGRYFGNRDHTTVMNAIEKITYLQEKDLDIRNTINDLTTQIHNITGM